MHRLLLIILLPIMGQAFHFLVRNNVRKTKYEQELQEIIAVQFIITPNMQQAHSKLGFAFGSIIYSKHFNLTQAEIKSNENSIFSQIHDFDMNYSKIIPKFKELNSTITNMGQAPKFTPDYIANITLDDSYTNQKFADLKSHTQVVAKIFETKKTIKEVIADTADMQTVTTYLELANQDLEHFVEKYYLLYKSLLRAIQEQTTPLLLNAILPLDLTPIDNNKILFLGHGIANKIPTFYIQRTKLLNPMEYNSMEPVAYRQFSLQDHYITNLLTNKIEKTHANYEEFIGENNNINDCVKALNSHDYQKVIDTCKFIYNDKVAVTTQKGVLFQKYAQDIQYQLNTKFAANLKQSSFPVYIEYTGTVNFIDENNNKIEINKNSTLHIETTTLDKTTLDNLDKYIDSLAQQDNHFLIDLIEDEYDTILLNTAILFALIILGTAINYIYTRIFYKRFKLNSNKFIEKRHKTRK
jgi:preprotein translocase subunit YajC